MKAPMEIGLILTAIGLLTMLGWSFRELRQVDRIIAEQDAKHADTEEESS